MRATLQKKKKCKRRIQMSEITQEKRNVGKLCTNNGWGYILSKFRTEEKEELNQCLGQMVKC